MEPARVCSMGDVLSLIAKEDLGVVEINCSEIESSPGTRVQYCSIRGSRGC